MLLIPQTGTTKEERLISEGASYDSAMKERKRKLFLYTHLNHKGDKRLSFRNPQRASPTQEVELRAYFYPILLPPSTPFHFAQGAWD